MANENINLDDMDFNDLSDEDLDAQIKALEDELGEDLSEDFDEDGLGEDFDEQEFDSDDFDTLASESTGNVAPVLKRKKKKKGIMDYLPKDENGKGPVRADKADFMDVAGEVVVQTEDFDSTKEAFEFKYVPIENIMIPQRIRKSGSIDSLVQSIKSTGLLYPIVLAPLMTAGQYVLIAGFRRLTACAKAGKSTIPCLINNNISTPEIPVVEAMYNHNKPYTMEEIIGYINYLEKEKGITSSNMIEYLLQLNSGDYTKLKDILNDNDPDIVDKLYNNQMTIGEAFRKLEQRRKKESAEEKEQRKAEKVYGESDDATIVEGVGDVSVGEPLSEEQVSRLEEKISDYTDVEDIPEEKLTEMIDEANRIPGFEANKQDWKNRERLAPELRKAILARDENTCQVCKEISGQEYTEVLDVHHIQEVYLGGDDSEGNLITCCIVCHKLIHMFARGTLYMRPYSEMSESEQNKFKRIVKLGTKIRLDMKAKNMSREQLKKVDNADTIGRTKPGTGQVAG